MTTHRPSLHTCDRCSGSDQIRCDLFWSELQNWLRPYVLSWIYTERLPVWRGQEFEIVNDVLQETCSRILKYLQPISGRDTHAIQSLEHFSLTVARNCVRDMWRRQHRLVRLTTSPLPLENAESLDAIDFSELALDHLMIGDLFMELACIINDFPPMQRQAILIDLAKHADFDEDTGLLQSIFLELGINLRDYHRARPLDPVERNKQASLLSIAYKRLRRTFSDDAKELVA